MTETAFDVLLVTGFVLAICTLALTAIYACSEILWRIDQRKALRELGSLVDLDATWDLPCAENPRLRS